MFACKFPCNPSSPPRSPDYGQKLSLKPWLALPGAGYGATQQRSHSTGVQGLLKSWSLTRTSQQLDPADQILAGLEDLREFSLFIFKKVCRSQTR